MQARALPDPEASCCRPAALLAAAALATFAACGCSVNQYAIDRAADALADDNSSFAQDDDPQLIREAVPFSLKTIESLIAVAPRNEKLLFAACRDFTEYTYAFVQQDADRLEDKDVKAARVQSERARKLYRRARDYGMRGLEIRHPKIRTDMAKALATMAKDDVGLLYWTAAAWAGEISLSKEQPDAIADVPQMLALADRAAALDDAYDEGAIPTLMISLEMVRQGAKGDPAARARARFDRAVALSGGAQASPFVAFAESVDVPLQDKAQFEAMIAQALAIDPDKVLRHRLANRVLQDRARWLQERKESLFAQ